MTADENSPSERARRRRCHFRRVWRPFRVKANPWGAMSGSLFVVILARVAQVCNKNAGWGARNGALKSCFGDETEGATLIKPLARADKEMQCVSPPDAGAVHQGWFRIND